MRIPNGILSAWQFRGVADIAECYGGGYADVTTRANLQIREIDAGHGIAVIEALQALGLTPKGSGADNIRNVTGSPLAGIDPLELIDTRPLASEWHHHILNDRSLYGLPRKFNVAFDGGGRLAGRASDGSADQGPIICACFAVGRNRIQQSIAADGCHSVEAVGAALRAGTNCGSCIPELRRVIASETARDAA